MNGNNLKALVALAWVATACEDPSSYGFGTAEEPIIGGQPSTDADFPNSGAILSLYDFGGGQIWGTLTCTATLIAPDVILTAAHCGVDFFGGMVPTESYFTFTLDVSQFGMATIDLPPRTYRIASFRTHPEFDLNAGTPTGVGEFKDVAIGYLASSITDVIPAVVADAQDAVALVIGTNVNIAGYGQREQNGQEAGIKYHAQSVINEVGTFEMQIGDMAPTPQKCHGDSGGPTYLVINDGRTPAERVVGITSHAYDQTDCARGGVDTRADAYWDFVNQAMIDGCTSGIRDPAYCATQQGLPRPAGGGTIDAGFADAGQSADASGPDATSSDTGTTGGDAGSPPGDAAAQADVGSGSGVPRLEEDGCSCHATTAANARGAHAILLLGLLLVRRRRSL